MAHNVKCVICGKIFNRDLEKTVKHDGRRYSHYDCEPDKPIVESTITEEEKELKVLKDYIKAVLGDTYNAKLVNKQIKEYHDPNGEYKYSYNGILKTLEYHFYVKHGDVSKALGGIGIVPYCFNAARDYYYALWLAQQQNQDKDVVAMTNNVKEIKIKIPVREPVPIKMFNLEWNEEELDEE